VFRKFHTYLYRVILRRTPVETLLRQIPMFAGLDRNQMHRLELVLYRRIWEQGEVICARGTPGNALYIVLEGSVGFAGTQQPGLCAGDFFGEAALFIDVRHACDTIALKRSELLVLFRHDFEQFAKRSPAAAVPALFAFARILAERSMEGNESPDGTARSLVDDGREGTP